ncbi:AAA family ATPase [candidate division KSB1 bacterium]|nr:AAA family ATPase [bacterium]NUM63916.1 AAA family ATPase [candidate division KSB1 bacterium]
MIERIKIAGYKSLDGVEITLNPLTVLFGPNGSGKSNFLDALQLLSNLVRVRTLKEAFESPYRGTPLESFAFGREGLRGLLQRDSAQFTFEVDVRLSNHVIQTIEKQIRELRRSHQEGGTESSDNGRAGDRRNEQAPDESTGQYTKLIKETRLRYRITIEILPKSGILQVADEYVAALSRDGTPSKKRRPFLERMQSRLHLRMERQSHLVYYDRFLDHTIVSQPLYAPHYPHLAALKQELLGWHFYYFEPRERMRSPNPVMATRHIGLMGENLAAFLNTLQALDKRKFQAIEKSLRTIVPTANGIVVTVNDLGQVELRVREGDAEIPARLLSEGTLRILGLLALFGAQEPPSLIGFEEPENGVHPRRIKLIAELWKNHAAPADTQVIITTHSPLLADLINDDCLYVCRRSAGRTSIEPFTTFGPLGRPAAIADALDEQEKLPVSERILRGDFDA